jgi:transcriptional regulator GlxA family with amidase domain
LTSQQSKGCRVRDPQRRVFQSRLERAKHLLRQTDQPLVLTALEAGFADESHLRPT